MTTAVANKVERPTVNPPTALEQLEHLAEQYALTALETKGRFERAVMVAEGIQALQKAVTPILARIMPLQNTSLGFLTDNKQGYSAEIVRDCLIEATLRGVYPVGNEFNIISGRCYITRNGYSRLVRELEGLTDLKLLPGVPKMSSGGAVVPFRATWKYLGRGDGLEAEIPVKMNTGMGVDALLGKAHRKMLARIYGQVTGSEHSDGEVDDVGQLAPVVAVPVVESKASQIADRLAAPTNGTATAIADPPKPKTATKAQVSRIMEAEARMAPEDFSGMLTHYGVEQVERLTTDQADAFVRELHAYLETARQPGDEAE